MLEKLLYKLVSAIINANYSLIALRLQLKNLFSDKSKKSDLELLYEDYIGAVRNKEIFPQSKIKNHQIFIDYRNKVSEKLSQEDEVYLQKALDGRTSRWFVPNVLAVIDSFSEVLMIKLIETGIKVRDPSYNRCFILPAQRVFDLKVNDYLVERFPNSNDREKGGILRLFYWVNSKLSTSMYQDGSQKEFYLKKYIWEVDKFKGIQTSEKNEIESYKKMIIKKNEERIALLLDEYFKTSKIQMKEAIAWYLPKELNDYPENLREKATIYLKNKNLSSNDQ